MRKVIALILPLLVFGCTDISSKIPQWVFDVPNVVPKIEPYSHYGNDPYTVYGRTYLPLRTAEGYSKKGIASWYGKKFHGKRTSSGETYDMYQMSAAHKTLPLPSYVRVTNLKNNKKIVVRVNDRGPFVDDRIIDLSYVAARKLELVRPGTGPVLVEAILPSSGSYPRLPNDNHYLQAGVFGNKDNAVRLSKVLQKSGIKDAHVKDKIISGSTLFQVLVGPIDLTDNVDQLIDRVAQYLPEEPIIVVE